MLLIPADYISIFNGAIIESANPQDQYFHPHGYCDFPLLLSIHFTSSITFKLGLRFAFHFHRSFQIFSPNFY
jgi:hypothetical protein